MPGVLAFFGGAFRIGGIDYPTTDAAYRRRTIDAHVAIVAVDYALAPEHRYPVQVEQGYAALVWLFEHAEELGVDPSRIGVLGISAGGNLAAVVALMNRDRANLPAPAAGARGSRRRPHGRPHRPDRHTGPRHPSPSRHARTSLRGAHLPVESRPRTRAVCVAAARREPRRPAARCHPHCRVRPAARRRRRVRARPAPRRRRRQRGALPGRDPRRRDLHRRPARGEALARRRRRPPCGACTTADGTRQRARSLPRTPGTAGIPAESPTPTVETPRMPVSRRRRSRLSSGIRPPWGRMPTSRPPSSRGWSPTRARSRRSPPSRPG